MYFGAMLGAYIFTSVISSCWIDPFIIYNTLLCVLLTVFDLKSILSDISIATPTFFLFLFLWNIFCYLLTFSLCVSVDLDWVSCIHRYILIAILWIVFFVVVIVLCSFLLFSTFLMTVFRFISVFLSLYFYISIISFWFVVTMKFW